MMSTAVRNNLRELRIRAGLSQKALAEMAGKSQESIHRWETGSRPLNDRIVNELSGPLQCEPEDFFRGGVTDGKDDPLAYLKAADGTSLGFPKSVLEGLTKSPAGKLVLLHEDSSLAVIDTESQELLEGSHWYALRDEDSAAVLREVSYDRLSKQVQIGQFTHEPESLSVIGMAIWIGKRV